MIYRCSCLQPSTHCRYIYTIVDRPSLPRSPPPPGPRAAYVQLACSFFFQLGIEMVSWLDRILGGHRIKLSLGPVSRGLGDHIIQIALNIYIFFFLSPWCAISNQSYQNHILTFSRPRSRGMSWRWLYCTYIKNGQQDIGLAKKMI